MREPSIFDEISDMLILLINSYFFVGKILWNRCIFSNMVHMVKKRLYETLRLQLIEKR